MGFRAASSGEVYRHALRLDDPNRSLTDRFGFSLIMINDGSPVCTEFLQRYFVDLCHRTADRIRFIFFSDLNERELRELERNIRYRYDTSPLKVILRMLSGRKRRYSDWEDDYPERRAWDELRPRGLHPVHSPEQMFRKLNRKAQLYSAVPGVREAHNFAQRLGIGRHVPCIVAFNDIGSLSVDVMPIGRMSPNEIYYHMREWVDSFYEQNQVDIHYWSEVERNIRQLQEKSEIPLRKINEWQYCCRESWKKLRILANAISEVSSLKENDRVSFVNLVDKYKKDYEFTNEVIRDFEKNYGVRHNFLAFIDVVKNLQKNKVNLLDAGNFKQLYSQLTKIIQEQQFYQKYCPEVIIIATIMSQRYLFLERGVIPNISEYLAWCQNPHTERASCKSFRKARKQWLHLLDESLIKNGFRTELKYVLNFVCQLPLSVNSSEGAKSALVEYSHYCKIEPNNKEWLTATREFISIFENYISVIKKIADECRTQSLQAIKESIKKYTISDDEFHQMRSGLINILQKHRNQLEAKINEIQKELLSSGFLKPQITAEEIQKLRNELDKYQSIINQLVYPHKEDPNVINVPISQPLVKTCGFSSQDLENQQKKQKDIINTLKQEIDILPREEQKNLKQCLEQWSQLTEKARRYSPEYALSYALQETIPKTTLERAFNVSEKEPEQQNIWTRDVRTLIPEVFRKSEPINLDDKIGTLLKQGTIIVPLLRLPENDLAKVVNILSQDKDNLPIEFNEQTHPVEEQILILIGADVIPALNYINQIHNNTMANLQTKIFSDLDSRNGSASFF